MLRKKVLSCAECDDSTVYRRYDDGLWRCERCETRHGYGGEA